MAEQTKAHGVRGQRNVALEREIGARIRTLRQAAGLSIDDMAARMGLKPMQLRKLENATIIIPVATLARAAEVLGVSVGEFYTSHDPGADSNRPLPHPLDNPEHRALIQAYKAAPAPVRSHFASLMEALGRR